MRGRRCRSLAVVLAAGLVAASGCTGASSNGHPAGQLKLLTTLPQPDGTAFGRLGEALPADSSAKGVLAILTASGTDASGHPVGVANRFSPNAEQVAVLVEVGGLTHPGTLAIDWYATDAAGKEILLTERKIPVDADEWAWSVGRASQPVRPGLYEAVAHLEGSEIATWFQVGDLQPPAFVRGSTSPSAETTLALGLLHQQAQGVWDEWNDGAAPDQPAPSPGGSTQGCELSARGTATVVSVDASARPAHVDDDCGRVSIAAAVSGDPVTVASGNGEAAASIDPCDLPGGNDLPGTVIHLAATAEHSAGTATAAVPLVDIGIPPIVLGEPAPADGTLVHSGDAISLKFGAVQLPFATGLRIVQFFANGELVRGWKSTTDTPTPCDRSRFFANGRVDYTVPNDPPPVVELLVRAEDYTGRFGWAAWHFPTKGTSWTGTATADLKQKVPSGVQTAQAEVRVTLFEDPDGNITGELNGGQTQDLDLDTCPSTTTAPGKIHADVSGTHQGDTISLELGRVDFTPPDVTPCPEGGKPGTIGSLVDPLLPAVSKALGAITRQSDGTFHAGGTSTGGETYPYTVTFSIDLKPTDQ